MSKFPLILIISLQLVAPCAKSDTTGDDCLTWYSTACWAHLFQNSIDNDREVSDGLKQYGDKVLSSIYQASQRVGAVTDNAGVVLQKAYDTLIETQNQVCKDDDLFFVESVALISAAILAVELTTTGGTSAGSGALALKALLIAQAPKLMSKLHQRLCGSPFTKADPNLVTQIETAIDKTLSGK